MSVGVDDIFGYNISIRLKFITRVSCARSEVRWSVSSGVLMVL